MANAAELAIPRNDLVEARFYSRNIPITGLGIVSGMGFDPETAYQNAIAGKHAIYPLDIADRYPQIQVHVGGIIPNYDPKERLRGVVLQSEHAYLHTSAQYNLDAAFQALQQAGLLIQYSEKVGARTKTGWRINDKIVDPRRVMVIGGTGVGGAPAQAIETRKRLDAGQTAEFVDVFRGLVGRVTTPISLAFGIQGGVMTVVAECATFNNAMGVAMDKLRLGRIDVVVVAAAEATIDPDGIGQFDKITALSRERDPAKAPRALDQDANGFVMANAGAAMVLERPDFARCRSAKVIAVASGYGESGDAHDKSLPHPEGYGIARAIEAAVTEAGGLATDGVTVYNGHYTGTEGDSIEDKGRKTAFERLGAIFNRTCVNALKPMFGHAMSASSAVEGVMAVKTIEHKIVPPIIKGSRPIEGTEGNVYVRGEARLAEVSEVVKGAAGFGGGNAVVDYRDPSLTA